MKDLHTFLSNIVNLWSIHHYREDLYKRTLAMHDLGPMRRVFSQGYTSSLLYKKEVQWLYDFSKCTLYDGDIHQYPITLELDGNDPNPQEKPFLIRKIMKLEAKTIKVYQSLLGQPNLGYDAAAILSDHLAKLNDINNKLRKELNKDFIEQIPHKLTPTI